MKKIIFLAATYLLFMNPAYAADKPFAEGKDLFQKNCLSCHDAQLDPPLAPPMFVVQMKYKMATTDKESFVNKLTSFATHPTKEQAILPEPVKVLGLMPDLGFAKADVKKVATYIHDETFEAPCNHWKSAMIRFKQNGNQQQYLMHKKRYYSMCSNQSKQTMNHQNKAMPMTAEEGTLKSVMQQLGKDYAALNQAILTDNFDNAKKAAHKIANHEKPSMSQKMKIMAGLRTEMPAFKKADDKVHDIAVEIEEAANSKNMPLLIKRQSKMLSACMACHTSYRNRVIQILK